jgi:hypothetical protein
MMSGRAKGTTVLVLIGVALTIAAIRSGRGALLLQAINGKQVVNR